MCTRRKQIPFEGDVDTRRVEVTALRSRTKDRSLVTEKAATGFLEV